ncbi:trichohyalin-like [Penaeus japonicus]|uniref:trichohyalin-like n=1 Tax=Penaeus japonicus TaxID=27405 RepID=UPI001C70CAD3|nr:trichohyalin-like [Penaeus japonicus]
MRNYLDEARELGLRGMQVLHYIEQQEKIRREKEERAYQEREEQRQEAEKRRHEARKQRKFAERQLKKQRFLREQEERALEERQRQKKDGQKAATEGCRYSSDVPEGCICLSFPGWNRSGPRVESWATQKLPGEGRRSEEPPATKHSLAVIVRSREDLSQQWIRRPNGQEQREHPGTGKARAQEAQSAETKAPVKAWAPEIAGRGRASGVSQQKRVHRRSRYQRFVHQRSRLQKLVHRKSRRQRRLHQWSRCQRQTCTGELPPDTCTGGAAPRSGAPEEQPPRTSAPEEPPPETCAPEEPLAKEEPPTMARTSGENDDLADSLPGIGRPLEEAIDVKCSPREPSRMRCTPEDPPVGSRSPEELLAEKESFPEAFSLRSCQGRVPSAS